MRIKMIAAAMAMFVVPGVAGAQSIQLSNWTWSPGLVKSDARRYAPASPSYFARDNLGVGQFQLTGTTIPDGLPVNLLTYCIDLYGNIDTGIYNYVSGASLVPDLQRRQQIETLLYHTNPALAGATGNQALLISAATQMAIWEIEYETIGSYDVAAGDFTLGNFQTDGEVYDNNADAIALSNSYLANFANNSWQLMSGLDARYLVGENGAQAQVYLNAAAVPEPSTWAMMLAGFGLVGAGMRRRKVKTSISFA